MREKEFSSLVQAELKKENWIVLNTQGTRTQQGMPDLIALKNGCTAFIELKVLHHNKIIFQPGQCRVLEMIHLAGCLSVVLVHSQKRIWLFSGAHAYGLKSLTITQSFPSGLSQELATPVHLICRDLGKEKWGSNLSKLLSK